MCSFCIQFLDAVVVVVIVNCLVVSIRFHFHALYLVYISHFVGYFFSMWIKMRMYPVFFPISLSLCVCVPANNNDDHFFFAERKCRLIFIVICPMMIIVFGVCVRYTVLVTIHYTYEWTYMLPKKKNNKFYLHFD